jgi:photosystem II stability/assembly factor-like uncharacterized protein
MTQRDEVHVYAGTAGHSAWFSEDGGLSWLHPNSHSGMYLEARVWCFASHDGQPTHLYAGTDMGLFRWDEVAARWSAMASPLADIWALAVDPANPAVILAGGRPAALCRSEDGGATWTTADVAGLRAFSDINMGPTRVTQILFDPVHADTVWATVEIGGILRSQDRGRSWTLLEAGLLSSDVHGIAVVRDRGGPASIIASTNRGLHRSRDMGENWVYEELPAHWQYARCIVAPAHDLSTVFVTIGNGPPGNSGRLMRSQDAGASWANVPLPGEINSTLWCLALHPADPQLMFCATNLGQLFRSSDGGQHWERLSHEFGELRALHWRPLPAGIRLAPHAITRPVVKVPNV